MLLKRKLVLGLQPHGQIVYAIKPNWSVLV